MPCQEHPSFPLEIPDSTKIWRYMSIPKFLSLLEYNSLFFSRGDKLGDPFEGLYPKPRIRGNVIEISLKGDAPQSIELNDDTVEKYGKVYPNIEIDESEDKLARESARKYRERIFTNCWHMSDHESDSLWNKYSSDKSIAIQSTVGRLKNSILDDNHIVYLFKITYIDDRVDTIKTPNFIFSTMIHKKIEYQSEKELRALILLRDYENGDKLANMNGINVKTNVKTLIENTYSYSSGWFRKLLDDILKRYKIDLKVKKSNLTYEPD
jgi:hypothetical protein